MRERGEAAKHFGRVYLVCVFLSVCAHSPCRLHPVSRTNQRIAQLNAVGMIPTPLVFVNSLN